VTGLSCKRNERARGRPHLRKPQSRPPASCGRGTDGRHRVSQG
jgi:hypothetical protein